MDRLAPSKFLASEIRAEMARQGITQRDLAARLGFSQAWVTRRIGHHAVTDMTFEDVVNVSKALDVSAESLVSLLLPRLDSNQQPSGYLFPLVSGSGIPSRCPFCREWHPVDAACPVLGCWCPESSPVHHPSCPERVTRASFALVA